MKRRLWIVPALLATALPASAAVVVERWGAGQDGVQHGRTITFTSAAEGSGQVMTVDLAALPKDATVHRARLFFFGAKWNDAQFRIVPQGAGKSLELARPYFRWFDATEAVGAWVKAGRGQGRLLLKQAPRFAAARTFLEITYEGTLRQVPPQVKQVKAVCRDGQVFVTFQEVDPPDGGQQDVSWADLAKTFRGDFYGPVDAPPLGKRRYLLLRHRQPVTPANVGKAELVAEVLPGTAFNTRHAIRHDARRKRDYVVSIEAGRKGEGRATGADVKVLRVAAEPLKPLPPGHGLFVHTVRQDGVFHYAVLTADDGVANTRQITAANTAGPIRQTRGDPAPVPFLEDATVLRQGKHVNRWYSYWTDQPMSPWPARYDVVVGYCPDLVKKPAPLHVGRSGWNSWPVAPRPRPGAGIYLTHTADMPVEFHTGLHDAMGTLKGFDGGTWQPFFPRRQDALVRWILKTFPADRNRVSASVGAWGAMELYRGGVYSYLAGWALTELTKGFQSWNRAVNIWGRPRRYRDRPDAENPYVASNLTDWVLAHPEIELPFLNMYARGGSHWSEMGWPPAPRFLSAMIRTKRAFVYSGRRNPLEQAINRGQIRIRLDASIPALGHCSLDDNPGEGDLRSADNFNAQLNGYVLWDSDSVRERPDTWELTLWIDTSSYYPTGTVDLTPRRCQRFKAKPGGKYTWTNTLLPAPAKPAGDAKPDPATKGKVVQQGTAKADQHGLVTIEKLALTKDRHHVVIRASR